jgi:hypothetical protein
VRAVTRDTAEAHMLTPEYGLSATILAMLPDQPATIVGGFNDRDATWGSRHLLSKSDAKQVIDIK